MPSPDKIGQVTSNDLLFRQFSEEFRNLCLDPQPIELLLSKLQAWALLGQLQLALRHPKNKGATADLAKHVAQIIQKQVAVTPALAEVAKRGWNHDVPEKVVTFSQVTEFISEYLKNGGRVGDKYCSRKDYIATDWQPIVHFLDQLRP
jgi:hypothetical protein